jgi:hypothetical protein
MKDSVLEAHITVYGRRNSSVVIATGYGLQGRHSIPGSGKIFLLFRECRPALGPIQPFIQWVPGTVYPGVKRSKCEAHLSLPSSAEVKNGRAITPLPHTSSWHGAYLIKHRDDLPLHFIIHNRYNTPVIYSRKPKCRRPLITTKPGLKTTNKS